MSLLEIKAYIWNIWPTSISRPNSPELWMIQEIPTNLRGTRIFYLSTILQILEVKVMFDPSTGMMNIATIYEASAYKKLWSHAECLIEMKTDKSEPKVGLMRKYMSLLGICKSG